MNNVSKIKMLYAYEDGDNITTRMGVQIAAGHGLQQFYNAYTREVTNTNFKQSSGGFPPTLFPQAYSSKAGAVIVPDANSGQWYYNNIADNTGILDANGQVKSAFANLFAVTTVTMNGKTFPALTIIDNLVKPDNTVTTDIYIYYVGTYNGKQFTCSQQIPVQSIVGDAYNLLVSVVGASGYGDEVLSDDNDYIEYTASLQVMSTGTDIAAAVIQFQHFENGQWVTISSSTTGYIEITGKKMKIFEAAVDGAELFRVVATYGGDTWYKILEPTDEHDPYYIVDGCSILGDSVKRGETVSFNAKVFKRHNGINEEDEDVTVTEGWTFTYTLIAQNTGSVITAFDQTGITYDRLVENGGIAVRTQARRV